VTANPAGRRDHYSYSVYADPATAASFDARRFGGPIGELVAASQAGVLLAMAGNVRGQRALDVGTGTGRAALLLAKAGAQVTGVDASDHMLAIARQRAGADGLDVRFGVGDVHALQFPDRAFSLVVSLRVLMHARDWRRAIAELCRVSAARVIVDYPSATSVAAIESAARRVTHRLGAATEPYRVFTARAIEAAFGENGFEVRAAHRQFVLPIALHKAVGSPRFTARAERWLERAGLLGLCGSPVTIVAERCAR
jgi:2-polyprenyl-3-methyl-5-hydroxy-6-metoxy-1,4-benzoquinol methylase